MPDRLVLGRRVLLVPDVNYICARIASSILLPKGHLDSPPTSQRRIDVTTGALSELLGE